MVSPIRFKRDRWKMVPGAGASGGNQPTAGGISTLPETAIGQTQGRDGHCRRQGAAGSKVRHFWEAAEDTIDRLASAREPALRGIVVRQKNNTTLVRRARP